MNRILALVILLAMVCHSLSCETAFFQQKTVREPGEPEHGGVFLHGDPSNAPTTR